MNRPLVWVLAAAFVGCLVTGLFIWKLDQTEQNKVKAIPSRNCCRLLILQVQLFQRGVRVDSVGELCRRVRESTEARADVPSWLDLAAVARADAPALDERAVPLDGYYYGLAAAGKGQVRPVVAWPASASNPEGLTFAATGDLEILAARLERPPPLDRPIDFRLPQWKEVELPREPGGPAGGPADEETERRARRAADEQRAAPRPLKMSVRARRQEYPRLADVELVCTLTNTADRAYFLYLRTAGERAPLGTRLDVTIGGRSFKLHHWIDHAPIQLGPAEESDFVRLVPGASESFAVRLSDYDRLRPRKELKPGELFPADARISSEKWTETGEVHIQMFYSNETNTYVKEGTLHQTDAWIGTVSTATRVAVRKR